MTRKACTGDSTAFNFFCKATSHSLEHLKHYNQYFIAKSGFCNSSIVLLKLKMVSFTMVISLNNLKNVVPGSLIGHKLMNLDIICGFVCATSGIQQSINQLQSFIGLIMQILMRSS